MLALAGQADKPARPPSQALEAAAEGGEPGGSVGRPRRPWGSSIPREQARSPVGLLTDAVSFRRLTLAGQVPVGDLLRSGARQVHAQGVVLPGLIAAQDVATLASILHERTLPEATRLGALEGLSRDGNANRPRRS